MKNYPRMSKRLFLPLCLLLTILPGSARGQSPKGEEKGDAAKEAVAVVNKLFDAMRAKDTEAIRSIFSAEGQLVATQRRAGQPSVRVFTGDSFAKLIVETKGVLQERMY